MKGLGFSPSIGPNNFGLFKDLNQFIRLLTLKRHFAKDTSPSEMALNTTSGVGESNINEKAISESTLEVLEDLWQENHTDSCPYISFVDPEVIHTDLKPKSKFYPVQSKGPYIETYYQAVYKDFVNLCENSNTSSKNSKRSNLNRHEKQALNDLTNNKQIIIKQADKGGSIVVQNRDDYLKEAHRLLADTHTYMKLTSDPLPSFQVELKLLVEKAWQNGVLNDNEKKFLLPSQCSTPHFYHLPKVHKSLADPPGRPIVASTNSFIYGLSVYIDRFLQPFVCQLPSYIRDSNQVLEALRSYRWESHYLWASLDVSSLYTSIPHEVGLEALQYFLSRSYETNSDQATFIVEGTNFCLRHNYFTFLEEFYLQLKGTAMGANFAPGYANLTMGYWEDKYIWADNPFARHIVFYGRYIDDIILIWEGSVDVFSSFVTHCNANALGLSFTHVIDSHELVFLDLVLSHEGDRIISKNHIKPTSGNSYLHYKSCHHPAWKRNIPAGQFNRLRRNCTKKEDYLLQGSLLVKRFEEKGYPQSIINEAFDRYEVPISNKDTSSSSTNINSTSVRFVTTYNDKYKKVVSIIKKHFNILKLDQRLAPVLPPVPQVTFKRARTVKNIIAPSKVQKLNKKPIWDIRSYFDNRTGIFQCKKRGCLTCQSVPHGLNEIEDGKGKRFKIKQFITCSTEFVIYVLRCPCGLLYVGRTIRTLRKRIGEHRRFIQKGCNEHSVPRHFLHFHKKDFRGLVVMAIEAIPQGTLTENERFSLLCKREVFWIYNLGSLSPGGLNEDLEVHNVV